MAQTPKIPTADLRQIRIDVAKALWRAELGGEHGLNADQLNDRFQAVADEQVTTAIRFLTHLDNLGYSLDKR